MLRRDSQQGLCSTCWLATPLFPVLQRPQADSEQFGKRILRNANFGSRFSGSR